MGWLDILDAIGGIDVSQYFQCMLVPLQLASTLASELVEGLGEVLRSGITGCISNFADVC